MRGPPLFLLQIPNDTIFVLAVLIAIAALMVLFMKRSQETAGSGRTGPAVAEYARAVLGMPHCDVDHLVK